MEFLCDLVILCAIKFIAPTIKDKIQKHNFACFAVIAIIATMRIFKAYRSKITRPSIICLYAYKQDSIIKLQTLHSLQSPQRNLRESRKPRK